MASSARRPGAQTCSNCDQPSPKLARLTRLTLRGDRIRLKVCRFCYLQLVPGAKIHRLPV